MRLDDVVGVVVVAGTESELLLPEGRRGKGAGAKLAACKLADDADEKGNGALVAAGGAPRRAEASPPEESDALAMSLELSRELLYIEGDELSEGRVDDSDCLACSGTAMPPTLTVVGSSEDVEGTERLGRPLEEARSASRSRSLPRPPNKAMERRLKLDPAESVDPRPRLPVFAGVGVAMRGDFLRSSRLSAAALSPGLPGAAVDEDEWEACERVSREKRPLEGCCAFEARSLVEATVSISGLLDRARELDSEA